ncbi:hypothetical protein [Peribacillus simplex]|uniref:hypothetical protein n=1 Tax=Peribacillus simplex TaxID=1478 RepID=UPI0024C16FF2|nr:hypothetical protein [Peribacillus simplex]WHY57613.1 hypothetical protein QNH43_04800 [Peribacillus simplex]
MPSICPALIPIGFHLFKGFTFDHTTGEMMYPKLKTTYMMDLHVQNGQGILAIA